MKNLMKFLLVNLILLYSTSSNAVDYSNLPAYEIEVVIFKTNNTQSAGSEIWPDLVESVSVENSVELHDNNSTTLIPGTEEKGYFYSKIPAENFRLTEEAEKISRSNKYEILYHSAWIQPGLDKDNAEFIHIKSVENTEQLNLISSLSSVQPDQNIDMTATHSIIHHSETETQQNALLDGVVKVELGRYLHINFDLKYQRNLAPIQGVMNDSLSNTYKELKYYPIQTHRRMRSKELHYIDHPLIGILVLATPYEAPVTESTTDNKAKPLLKLQDTPYKN